MKSETSIYEQVKELLITNLQIDEKLITPKAELVNDLGINSLELADLVLLCEEKYGTEIDDKTISRFITVDDVVRYLETLSAQK